MSYEISTKIGYGSKLKANEYFDEHDITDDEGVIFGAFGDACEGGPDFGYYVLVKDASIFEISDYDVRQPYFNDWCIKIPNIEQYKLDLWRDKIISFCAKRNIDFEEPGWLIVTFGG